MKPDDQNKFKALVYGLTEEYQQQFSNERLMMWWEKLKEFEYHEVANAIDQCITSCNFFPRLANVFEFLRKDGDFKIAAHEAWQNLQVYLKRSSAGDDEFTQRVVGLLGGARALAMQTETQLQFTANRFIDLYQTIAKDEAKSINKISYDKAPAVVREISTLKLSEGVR